MKTGTSRKEAARLLNETQRWIARELIKNRARRDPKVWNELALRRLALNREIDRFNQG